MSIYNEQPLVFGLCAFALFTVRWANLYQPHVRRLIPKVWTHNWANFHYIRVAIYVYRRRFWFSIGVTSYLDVVFDRAFNNNAEFLSNDPLSSLLGWSLHKNGRLHDGRLNSLNTSFFYGSSNHALWNIHTAVSPSGTDTEWETSQEFLPPPTQLITKYKRRTKITGKIKRSKQSHSYYPNSVATDRFVLAGDVETNPGPDDAKTGRKKSVQNIAVKKSCLTCNKTIRLNEKELTCNLCSGSFHYKCEAGKLKIRC